MFPIKSLILFVFLSMVAAPLQAIELFGIPLDSALRDNFRSAVKKSGAKLLSEAGKDAFYDTYEGSALLHNAQRLYLGFVKQDQRLAFVEYEFSGLQQPVMLLALLTRKYGKPRQQAGKFLSDFNYQWTVDGIEIRLYQDWAAYKTRLSYNRPQALKTLQVEQKQYALAQRNQLLVYNEAAF